MQHKTRLAFLRVALFCVLFSISIAAVGVWSFATIGPSTAGIASVILPLLISIPAAFILFLYLTFKKRAKWQAAYGLPLLVLPVLFSFICAYTMLYERNPEHMFRVFVSDPIPAGISHIQAEDVSAGIDLDIVISFNTTSKALDEIVTKNKLKLDENGSRTPDENLKNSFPEDHWNRDWTQYSYHTQDEFMELWVNSDRTEVMIHYGTF